VGTDAGVRFSSRVYEWMAWLVFFFCVRALASRGSTSEGSRTRTKDCMDGWLGRRISLQMNGWMGFESRVYVTLSELF